MLAANEAVAETIHDRGLHFLRRVHQSPSPQKLARTDRVCRPNWATRPTASQSRFELQKLLAAAVGRPEQHAVHFAVLRSLQRAIYSPMEEGHYALASDCYCHFTSPIRRYPDLTIHRLVDAILPKDKPRNDLRRAGGAGRALLRPRAAGRGGRARADQGQAAGLPERPDRRGNGRRGHRRGELTACSSRASSCRPKGWCASRRCSDDYYHFDRASHTLAGHRAGNSYRLGDLVRVAVTRVRSGTPRDRFSRGGGEATIAARGNRQRRESGKIFAEGRDTEQPRRTRQTPLMLSPRFLIRFGG